MPSNRSTPPPRGADSGRHLRFVAPRFDVAFVVHGADCASRGSNGADRDAAWPGWFQFLMVVPTVLIAEFLVWIKLVKFRYAPIISAVVMSVVGVLSLAPHGLPAIGHASDSFLSAGRRARATGFAWFTAFAGTISALALGAIGLRAWLSARGAAHRRAAQSLPHSGMRQRSCATQACSPIDAGLETSDFARVVAVGAALLAGPAPSERCA